MNILKWFVSIAYSAIGRAFDVSLRIVMVLAFLIAPMYFFKGERPDDDTDRNGARSGLMLRTDHGTGCQYLEGTFSGIVPRVDASGKHICGKR